MNRDNICVPTGITEEWNDFPWEKNPAGVTLHFVVTSGNKIYLHRRGHGYWVCEQILKKGEVLEVAVTRLKHHLSLDGIQLSGASDPVVRVARQDSATVRVLVQIECQPVASRLKFESFTPGLLLDGLIEDHPMVQDLNALVRTTRRLVEAQAA